MLIYKKIEILKNTVKLVLRTLTSKKEEVSQYIYAFLCSFADNFADFDDYFSVGEKIFQRKSNDKE